MHKSGCSRKRASANLGQTVSGRLLTLLVRFRFLSLWCLCVVSCPFPPCLNPVGAFLQIFVALQLSVHSPYLVVPLLINTLLCVLYAETQAPQRYTCSWHDVCRIISKGSGPNVAVFVHICRCKQQSPGEHAASWNTLIALDQARPHHWFARHSPLYLLSMLIKSCACSLISLAPQAASSSCARSRLVCVFCVHACMDKYVCVFGCA